MAAPGTFQPRLDQEKLGPPAGSSDSGWGAVKKADEFSVRGDA